jgi:MOSC domain-containing protein YiiM
MPGIVLQVNTSRGGVPKRAIEEATITIDGLVGDAWNHPNIHGGRRQAALLITAEGIEDLAALGFPLYPGALGENITSRLLDRRAIRLGQRYRVGSALLEITRVRVPCATLNVYGTGIQAAMYDVRVQAGDTGSPRWGLSGFYAAVVEPGAARVGDSIDLL